MSALFSNALKNWKTTLPGVIVIVLGGLHLMGIAVPGYSDPGITADLSIGAGLILAQDSTKSLSDIINMATGTPPADSSTK